MWSLRKAKDNQGRGGFVEWTLILLLLIIAGSIFGFSDVCQTLGIQDGSGRIARDADSCLYFSLITWTTVGYGDFAPTPDFRIFAALEALLGYLMMGIFLVFLVAFIRIEPDRK
jgi:hypothetical protein